MSQIEFRKKQAAYVAKRALPAVAITLFAVGAHAAPPDVTEVVSSIGGLEKPVAMVGGAYIGLKVFQRGWKIIRGFI